MELLTLLLAAAAPATTIAGLYQAQQMEVGAALELRKNGQFRYQLDYGAVSEQAEGEWTFDGKTVRLTTPPKANPPSFELVRDDPAPSGDLVVTVEPPGFGAEGYRIDMIATEALSGRKGLATADENGRVETAGHNASEVDPLIPVYGSVGGRFMVDPKTGHHLLLRFHANDLGHADFDREPLALTARGLVLHRYETQIRFIRVRP